MLGADDIEQTSRITELDGLLVASLAPDLGPASLQAFSAAVMARLAATPRRAMVLDCAAVLVMDTHEFARLVELGEMCRMLGTQPYLAALSPGIAIHLALTLQQTPQLRFCRDLDHARSLVQQELA